MPLRILLLSLALWVVVGGPLTAENDDRDAASDVQRRASLGPVDELFKRHCQTCHSGDEPQGDLNLDRLSADLGPDNSRGIWLKVLKRVESGEMPPADKPRPSRDEIRELGLWLGGQLARHDAGHRATHGRVGLRRLNRREYENTLRDLLAVETRVLEQLPQDGAADGFDNGAAALHTSSFLMEKYLEAAETALNQAIVNRPRPPSSTKRYLLRELHPVKTSTESVYRYLDDTVVCLCSSEWHNVWISPFYPSEGGFYRFRIAARGYQSGGKPITFRVTVNATRLTGKDGLVNYFDAPADETKVFEFVRYMEPRTTIAFLPYGLPNAQTVDKIGAEKYEGPGLAVEWVEVEGPLYESWPPPSHSRLLGDLPQKPAPPPNERGLLEVVSEQPTDDARRIIRAFAERAFRRSISDDQVAPLLRIFEDRLAHDYSFEQALRATLKGALVSPEFLFFAERPGRLDDFALANRLSYFLWSTMPDERLRELARSGQPTAGNPESAGPATAPAADRLSNPEVLRGQVERLLEHPKSAAFVENFLGQWLGLREIDFTEPSHILYPEFDHLLKVSMILETESFFRELLKHDLSVTNLVSSDFSMLNARLAKHYGIKGVDGFELRRVPLPVDSHRGGILTMASVLKVTANGTTTSPVVRGAWVLDRLLGTPPSPPPADVPIIEPDIRGATTIRQQLAKHRAVAACASCHAKIDPPGFALENFDCIGGWRDDYRVTGHGAEVVVEGRRMAYHRGKPVEAGDSLPDGRAFRDIDELKQLLLADRDQVLRALTIRLVTYATGAAPTVADRPEVEAIVTKVRTQGYGLRSLVHAVVQSRLFLEK